MSNYKNISVIEEIAKTTETIMANEGEYQNSEINENAPRFLQLAKETQDKNVVIEYIKTAIMTDNEERNNIYRYLENVERPVKDLFDYERNEYGEATAETVRKLTTIENVIVLIENLIIDTKESKTHEDDATERENKIRKLAERLQDVFEVAYEDNQPFATKEECIADIEKWLNLEDVEFMGSLIDNLKMILNEYNLGATIDGETMALRKELETLINQIETKESETPRPHTTKKQEERD